MFGIYIRKELESMNPTNGCWRHHSRRDAIVKLLLCCVYSEDLIPNFLLQILKDIKFRNQFLKTFFWFLGTGRNALVVLLCAVASYIFEIRDGAPFLLTGHINAGLPRVESPSFTITVRNETQTFLDICKHFGSGIIVVPLISIIGNVAIAKAFCKLLTYYFLFILSSL